jgi:hypothetical protein
MTDERVTVHNPNMPDRDVLVAKHILVKNQKEAEQVTKDYEKYRKSGFSVAESLFAAEICLEYSRHHEAQDKS